MAAKRLDVNKLAAPDLELGVDDDVFLIRGKLTVQELVGLLEIEKRIRAAVEPLDILSAAGEANGIVLQLIRERYPDVAMPELNIEQSAGVLAFIASGGEIDVTVEQVVAQALADGIDVDAVLSRDTGQAVAETLGASETKADGTPLAPASDSPQPSSTSADTTDGNPNGGTDAPGERSASTPLISTAG